MMTVIMIIMMIRITDNDDDNHGSVWLVSNEGQVYLRHGVSEVAPSGQVRQY